MDLADGWEETTIYLGHDKKAKKIVSFSVRTSVVVFISTSIEYENDCFERKIAKTEKTLNVGRGRSVVQNNHYFRSYRRHEILGIQYELLNVCIF